MKNNNKLFNIVIIIGILLIPFMYSFFYLKAYWNPYGEGNIDNLDIAIVNLDSGDRGDKLINSIKKSKKLKINLVDKEKAEDGLYNSKYYAVITIPEDFTSDLNSASTNNKKHATITYSPNQKSNYLASQIINNVVNTVEKNLDNQVNSAIVGSLSEKVEDVPNSLDKVSNGFGKLKDGTKKLSDGTSTLKDGAVKLKSGSNTLYNGTDSLSINYDKFNKGVKDINDGLGLLNESSMKFNSLKSSVNDLINGVDTINNSTSSYVYGVNLITTNIDNMANNFCSMNNTYYQSIAVKYATTPELLTQDEISYLTLCGNLNGLVNNNGYNTIKQSGVYLKGGMSSLKENVSGFTQVNSSIDELQLGVKKLSDGSIVLYNSSEEIKSGINKINTGAKSLNEGINSINSGVDTLDNGAKTLDSSVKNAKDELDSNIKNTKQEVKKVESLKEYSSNPVKINTDIVNEVSSYGTAFSPFFISIALWVGCLMMYIVLYYDKEERFEIFGMKNTNRIKRTACYHGLASLSAIVLGTLLMLFLDFEITNVLLYYFSIILVANLFMAIIGFLIVNFNDIGKFISLILLVLQLAASGGTFPIQTVTKGFRFLYNYLPMTYTIKLLRESLVSIESSLLTKNLVVIIIMLLVFLSINIITDIRKQKSSS